MRPEIIEKIKQGSEITEVITASGIALKKFGNSYRGKCPFHDGKNNNLSIDPVKQYFHCFKCSESGDVIEFVKKKQNLTFIESVKFLAEKFGMSTEESITEAAGNEPKAAAKMYMEEIRKLSIPSDWYQQETFGYGKNHSATIRFQINKGCYWERIIDAYKFDRKAHFSANYRGLSWQPPGQVINKGDDVYIAEGIFDAIALSLSLGVKVVSAMSSGNFPQEVVEKNKGRKITWCIAPDYGFAGKNALLKWSAAINDLGERCKAFYPQDNRDWNDLYKKNAINKELMLDCYFRGQKAIAKTVQDAFAWHIAQFRGPEKWVRKNSVMAFNNCYYRCSIDEKSMTTEMEELRVGDNSGDYAKQVNMLSTFVKVVRISTATAKLLYTQLDKVELTHSYYFEVAVKGVKQTLKLEFSASMIGDANSFNQAMLKTVGQATFGGDSGDLKQIQDSWFARRKPTVDTIRHMGYSMPHEAYIFKNFAYRNGEKYMANKHNYIQTKKIAVKTTFAGWNIPKECQDEVKWINDLLLCGGNNALTGASFWLMSLFAQQIRKKHGTIPFWEYTGVGGSGKSTIIAFLWKLVGRDEYEGEDPEKMRPAALARTFMQASNIPVVLLEGDRDEKNHNKKLSMDHLKTLFAGQSPYARAVFNSGIDTDNEPFLGTLVVSQNAEVTGPMQIISRFVTSKATKKGFNNETYKAANRIKSLKVEDCVGFLHKALKLEREILKCYDENYSKYRDHLMAHEEIHEPRICETHAQIIAFGRALQLVVSELTDETLKNWITFIVSSAVSKQQDCTDDIPLVANFWDIFDAYDEKVVNSDSPIQQSEYRLNHSCEEGVIAIHLNKFKEFAVNKNQYIDISALQRTLRGSKRYKFLDIKKVHSRIEGKSLHCWTFKRED